MRSIAVVPADGNPVCGLSTVMPREGGAQEVSRSEALMLNAILGVLDRPPSRAMTIKLAASPPWI